MKYVIFLILISCSSGIAQDFTSAIEGLHNKYKSAEKMHISMSVNAYVTAQSQQAFYHEKVIIDRDGVNYRCKLTGTEMMMNDKYIIAVDHQSRQIILNKRNVEDEASFYKQANFNLDSIFQFYEGGKFEGSENGVNRFSVIQKTGAVQKIDLFIHQQSGHLRGINYVYKTGQFITIAFDEFELTPTFAKEKFNEQQFIHKSGKSWQPSASFSGYRVVNVDDSNAALTN